MSVPGEFVDDSGTIRFEGHIDGTGLADQTDTNNGPLIYFDVPIRLGAAGITINSGSGVPAIGGNVGDLYFDKAGDPTASTYAYACTTAGLAGAAVWTALVTA